MAPRRAAADLRLPGGLKKLAESLKNPARIVDAVSHPDQVAKALQETSGRVDVDRAVQELGRSGTRIAGAVQSVGRDALAKAAPNGTAARPSPVPAQDPEPLSPSPKKPADGLLAAAGDAIKKAAEAAQSKGNQQAATNLLRGKGPKEIGKVLAGAAQRTAGLSEGDLRKIGATVQQESPKLAKMLEHTSPREVEEVGEALSPERVEAALRAIEDYHWWTLHWRWALVTLLSALVALFAGCWGGRLFWRALRPGVRQAPMLGGMEMGGWSNGEGYEQPIVEQTQTHFEQF